MYNQLIRKSMENKTPITLVMHDPFEAGKTYEVNGTVIDYSQKLQQVKVKSSSEVYWLPLEDLAEIREPSIETGTM